MNAVGRPSAFVDDHLAPRQAELASGHHEQTVAHTRSAEPQYTQQWAGRERDARSPDRPELSAAGTPVADMSDLAAAMRRLTGSAYAGCTQTLCGADFDVVLTTFGDTGDRMLRWMDRYQTDGCGPVIANYERDALMWLVPPGTVHAWEHAHGLCFGGPFKILLPPSGTRTAPGPHWRRPRRLGHPVDADCLRHALSRFRPDLPRPVMRLVGTPLLPGTPPMPLLPS
ncbi:hypothetical protein OG539_01370 [Actinacidiphila glaucinigra]|uniref:hypothetical protein n=1 Tax=Actinacidiphila glaucinigra TaxID=235986 RepID=UPI0032453C6F